ncbi:hypothetical protein JNB61_10285 [Microbacterium ureisolvens]|uniref:Uncharacterized protein n=1 Tax=Microbacterium ureisolvens TaxID=2781186 RepID=A0ABS7I058_9MICO|nr:hypothetical protein [Microbacterium ureisolvens]
MLAAALSTVAALALTSCSASEGEDGASSEPTQLVQKNQQQWAMPLDEFAVASMELGNYAEQLLLGKCLNNKGYQWDVPWQNTDFKPPANFNRVGIKLFDVETAQQWGYGLAPPADEESSERWTEFTQFADAYHPDAKFEDEFLSCLQEVRDPDTMRDAEQLDYIMSLKIQATDVARSDPVAREAAKKWKQCVADQYSFDVPNVPQEMPPASLMEQFGLSGSARVVASAGEIDIAVADAKCQESSGYAAARYQAEWDAEVELLVENRDKLERIRAEALAHREELLTVVASNAPRS